MTEQQRAHSPALLKSYLDKVAEAHSCIQDLHVDIGRIRQDARADGYNMEAIHLLGQILAKSPHDDGVGLMNDIIKYATEIGIELEKIVVNPYPVSHSEEHDDGLERRTNSRFFTSRLFMDRRIALFFQLTFGLVLAGAFIWFLH